jgi:hypothetical protein
MPEIPAYVNDTTGPSATDADCAWYKPPPGFFNLNPQDFGLSYAILDIYGQPVCPAPTDDWGDNAWDDWRGGKPPGKSSHGHIVRGTTNPLACLKQRQSSGPTACYALFNKASIIGQDVAFTLSRFCPAGTPFRNAMGQCADCAKEHGAEGAETSYPPLQVYLNACNKA